MNEPRTSESATVAEIIELLRGDIREFESDLGKPQAIAMLGRLDEIERLARELMALNSEEQTVMDHILEAMQGIKDMGLRANENELAQAVHVLQGFVIQHMLQRLGPNEWGAWYA